MLQRPKFYDACVYYVNIYEDCISIALGIQRNEYSNIGMYTSNFSYF